MSGMLRHMLPRFLSSSLLAALALVTACSDDSEARLQKALGEQGVNEVKVTEETVTAVCSSGATVEIPATELERNFLGMAKASKVTAVGRQILQDCDTKDKEKAREVHQKAMMADEAKRLAIDTTGLEESVIKKAICEKLTAELPRKDPDRTVDGLKNTQRWGCEPPPPVEPLKTGAWAIDVNEGTAKKPGSSFLRLENGDGEKLTVRCTGKQHDLYLQPAKPAKKGTKLLMVRSGGAKPAKWKVKSSTDGKALFFPDTKAAFKALFGGDEMSFVVPVTKKKSLTSTFAVKGFGEAWKQLPKSCQ